MTDPRNLEREFSEPWTRVSDEWIELESEHQADRTTELHRDTDIPGVDLSAIYGPDAIDSGAKLAVGHGDPVALDPDEILDLAKALLITYNLTSEDIPTDPVGFLTTTRKSISQTVLEGLTHVNSNAADTLGPVRSMLTSDDPRHVHYVNRELDELLESIARTLRDVDAGEHVLYDQWDGKKNEDWTLELESEHTEDGDRDD